MNKLQKIALGVGGAVTSALAYAGSALAVYTPDAMDTAIEAGVTSIQDRIGNFFTDNLPALFLLVGGIIALFFAIKVVKRLLGR